jgi:hypothetical protein
VRIPVRGVMNLNIMEINFIHESMNPKNSEIYLRQK